MAVGHWISFYIVAQEQGDHVGTLCSSDVFILEMLKFFLLEVNICEPSVVNSRPQWMNPVIRLSVKWNYRSLTVNLKAARTLKEQCGPFSLKKKQKTVLLNLSEWKCRLVFKQRDSGMWDVGMCTSWMIQARPHWNISTTIRWISMKFGSDVQWSSDTLNQDGGHGQHLTC